MKTAARNMNSMDLSPLQDIDFLHQFVQLESYSGAEQEAAGFVVKQMKALGFREAYIDQAGSPVGIWGKSESGSAQRKRIMLVGHIDTVPGAIPVRIEETNYDPKNHEALPEPVLFGRGSVDAKGPFAAFIQAVALLNPDIEAELVVVGAVEEEASSSKGARQVLQDFSEPDIMIIGEPSNTSGITLGYKGRLCARFDARRPMTHSAHAHIPAGELAFLYYERVRRLVADLNLEMEGIFYPLDCVVQSVNTESDGLSERATMNLGFRLGPAFRPDELRLALDQAFSELQNELSEESEVSLSFSGDELAVQYDKKSTLVRIFRNAVRAHGLEPRLLLKTGTSDMNVLGAIWDCPMLAYGPGDSALDHTPEERIRLSDYRTSVQVLRSALERLCAAT